MWHLVFIWISPSNEFFIQTFVSSTANNDEADENYVIIKWSLMTIYLDIKWPKNKKHTPHFNYLVLSRNNLKVPAKKVRLKDSFKSREMRNIKLRNNRNLQNNNLERNWSLQLLSKSQKANKSLPCFWQVWICGLKLLHTIWARDF